MIWIIGKWGGGWGRERGFWEVNWKGRRRRREGKGRRREGREGGKGG